MESYKKQVVTGIPLGKGHFLRLFPVWMDYRGHFGTILPQAQALAAAGLLRNDQASADLAEQQLEWIIGKNPFAESTMYGEGYDFVPLYTPSSGDMVGGLPVGIETRGEKDVPYWPVQSTWTYKEIWGHPPTNWLWLLSAIEGPAVVRGHADSAVHFIETTTKDSVIVKPERPDGHFFVKLPEGNYQIKSAGVDQERAVLPGGEYTLDLRADSSLALTVTRLPSSRELILRITARGNGEHRLGLRTDGVVFSNPQQGLSLRTGIATTLEFRGKIVSSKAPWVVLVVPDGDWEKGKEVKE
jgi:hypothetical protein